MAKIPINKYGRDLEPEETFVGILANIEEEFDETLKAIINYPELRFSLKTKTLQEAKIFQRRIINILLEIVSKAK